MNNRIYDKAIFRYHMDKLSNSIYCPFCFKKVKSDYYTINGLVKLKCNHCKKITSSLLNDREVRDRKINILLKK